MEKLSAYIRLEPYLSLRGGMWKIRGVLTLFKKEYYFIITDEFTNTLEFYSEELAQKEIDRLEREKHDQL